MEIKLENRPPYVVFEVRAEEDRDASIEAGHFVSRDVDYALITPSGSKDCIERVAVDWFAKLESDVLEGRFPREWLSAYKGVYKDWKEGRETPLTGTPLLTWPVASPAQIKNLIGLQIRTVEDLATANEEVLNRFGMGARGLKQKAVDWLASAGGAGKMTEELSALRVANTDLAARNEELAKQLSELSATVKALSSKGQKL